MKYLCPYHYAPRLTATVTSALLALLTIWWIGLGSRICGWLIFKAAELFAVGFVEFIQVTANYVYGIPV